MIDHSKIRRAKQYIDRLRNPRKRAYALLYLAYLLDERPEPDHSNLSAMGAQAVRNELISICAD